MASKNSGEQLSASEEVERRYLIERLLVRTSLASQGQDDRLDTILSELRRYLRGPDRTPGQLRAFQKRLDNELERLDDHLAGEAREVGRVLGSLLSPVEGSNLFKSGSSELRRLRKELGASGLPRHRLLPWLDAFSQVTEQALARPEQVPEKGLLDRLFHRRDSGQETAAPQQMGHPADDGPEMNLGPALSDAEYTLPEDRDQRLRIARRVGELMDRLIQQVELPPDTHERAVVLKSRLSGQQDWDLLRQSLNETADLVISVVTHSQKEFESFLQRLDERLSSLHGHFSEHAGVMEGRRSSAADLEQTLQAELSELGHSLNTSSDLPGLRSSVSHHIEQIARNVEVFCREEEGREQLVSEQMETMREKLVAMETHAEQIRKQLEQERARALTDILTQLPNREGWDERLGFEHDRWQRYGRPVALAVIDIDHFKQVNDSFGHKAGDRVIQLVAKTLRERLRTTDFVARYGGEEFVALLPETSCEQANTVLDELRIYVGGMPFHFQGKPVRVTVSVGLSCFREGVEPETVFEEADKALYTAKTSGRNRLESALELKS